VFVLLSEAGKRKRLTAEHMEKIRLGGLARWARVRQSTKGEGS